MDNILEPMTQPRELTFQDVQRISNAVVNVYRVPGRSFPINFWIAWRDFKWPMEYRIIQSDLAWTGAAKMYVCDVKRLLDIVASFLPRSYFDQYDGLHLLAVQYYDGLRWYDFPF